MKTTTAIIIMVLFCFTCLSSITNAEEIGQIEGENHCYRWKWTYINSNGDVKKCRLKLSNDMLTGVWATSYTPVVINHWNTLDQQFGYSKDKVYAYDVAFDSAKCDLYTATNSNLSWFMSSNYDDISAITLLKNSSGQWNYNPSNGNSGSFSSGEISYARVYYKTVPATTQERYYIMRHEIGHVLGMGHVYPSKTTLMITHYSPASNNMNDKIYYVTNYDISVLEGFYPNP